MPLSATACVPAPAPALTFNVAVLAPFAVGANTTLIVQVDPAATEGRQLQVSENCPGFAPERVMVAIGSATLPLLVTVTGCAALVGARPQQQGPPLGATAG